MPCLTVSRLCATPNDDFAFALFEVGPLLATLVYDRMKAPDSCVKAAAPGSGCVMDWVKRMGRKAFRRPLTPEEADELATLFETERTRNDSRAGVESIVQALVLSPSFLVRTELGDEDGTMTSHEVAQALSYWLLNSPPDAVLDAAADKGELATPAAREAQVQRLLTKPSEGVLKSLGKYAGVKQFLYEWLKIDSAPAKDDRIYGGNREGEFWSTLRGEFEAFASDHLWNREARWDQMLTDNAAYPNQRLLFSETNGEWNFKLPAFPGGLCDPKFPQRPATCDREKNRGSDFQRVEGQDLDGPRVGFLTSPILMASHSLFDRTDAVLRGKWVRHVLLCQEPPLPPPTVATVPPPPSKELTSRQRFAEHSKDATCAGCHKLMDPIGFALETYDAVGRYRMKELSPSLEQKGLYFESGLNIDPSGELTDVTIDGKSGTFPFKNATELGGLLARTEEAQACFVESALGYAMGRTGREEDACLREDLRKRFSASGFNVIKLFAAIAGREAFVARAAEQ